MKNNEDSMDDDEEPNFSDPEGYVDDVSDEGEYIILSSALRVIKLRHGCIWPQMWHA